MIVALTPEKLEATIRDFFKDFFEEIKFFSGVVEGKTAIGFQGLRNGNKFDYSFTLDYCPHEGEMLHHWLESLKGDFTRSEETILLQHQKAAN